MATRTLRITDEKSAFRALERALQNELGDSTYNIEFVDWPKIVIRLDGPGYNSSITADVAEALVGIQTAVNRSYARLVHQTSDSRGLTGAERSDLQFKAKVGKGSSLITVDLGDFATKLTHELVTKMSPEQLVISVVGVVVTAGSVLAYKSFLKARSEDKKIETEASKAIALSQEETRRLETFAKALQSNSAVQAAKSDFDDSRNTLLKSVGDAKNLAVNDVSVSQETAKVLASSRRTPSEDVQLNGTYLILSTDLRQQDYIKLRVRRVQDSKEFSATFQDHSLDGAQIKLLQDAEWGRSPVFLSINATVLRGEVTTAGVVSVSPQPTSAARRN